jgi:hypothetical protein
LKDLAVCTSAAECAGGHCACGNVACGTRLCAPLDCPGGFFSAYQNRCVTPP